MAEYINAASLVKYNANVRGNDVGDCVCRSLSFAFDMSYSKMGKLLNAAMKAKRQTKWNITTVFETVIKDQGGSDPQDPRIDNTTGEVLTDDYPTVEQFADANPSGCYLVLCGRSATDRKTTHIVCIIDDKIYDSWDCRKWYTKEFYICSADRHVAESNVEKNISSLAEDACSLADAEVERYTQKWITDGEHCRVDPIKHYVQAVVEGYTIKLSCRFSFWIKDDTFEEDHSIKFPMNIVLKPGMADEDAAAFVTKTVKQRVYDRMYKVREMVRDSIDAFEAAHQEGAETADQDWLFMSAQEKKLINQLPGKVRPFISYINIYSPGKYSNSYTVDLKKLPGDPNNSPKVRFESYESHGVKDMIKRYVETFERPYDDYDPFEEGYT